MKKNVLYVFSLLLYILAACTLVSQKIETEMITLAAVRDVDFTDYSGKKIEMPLSAVFTDAEGGHLYEIVDGTGWENGLRFQEISESIWNVEESGIVSMPAERDYRIVQSASRQPQPGEPVEVLGRTKPANDRYLAIYTEELPEEFNLPITAEIAARSSRVLLLDMTNAATPFLEHRAKNMSITTSSSTRIFSLTDVAQFLETIPLVVLLAVVLAAPVLIWLYSSVLVRNTSRNKGFLLANIGLVAGLLCFAVWIMKKIDLPASMLPVSNIFEFDYYSSELSMVFDSLHELGDAAPDITGMVDGIRQSALAYAMKGILLTFAVILVEAVIFWYRQHRHSRKTQQPGNGND